VSIEVSTEHSRLDVERIHRWLSEDAYWSLGRSLEVVARYRLKRVLLATADAHDLYRGYGFEPLAHPSRFMAQER